MYSSTKGKNMKLATGIYTHIINGSKWLIVSKKAITNLTKEYRALIDEAEMVDNNWVGVDLSGENDNEYDLTKQRVILCATDGRGW